MAANGIIFGLAYKDFDNSLEYYYLRAILKVYRKSLISESRIVLHVVGQGSGGTFPLALIDIL